MTQNIFVQKIDKGKFGSSGDTRLFVRFSQTKGAPPDAVAPFEWTPHWNHVCEILSHAADVERANETRTKQEYLTKFVETCQRTTFNHLSPTSVKLEYGYLKALVRSEQSQCYKVTVMTRAETDKPYWRYCDETWPLAIPLTDDKIRYLLNRDAEWLIWDDKVIGVRALDLRDRDTDEAELGLV